MINMKKFLSILLCLSVFVCLAACGDEPIKNTDTASNFSNEENIISQTDTKDKSDDLNENSTIQETPSENNLESTIDKNQNNHKHNYSSSITKEATCGSEGVRTYKCSCGHSYTESISKTSNHNWEEATCVNPKTCKTCGVTTGEAKGHWYPTKDGKCSHCNQINPAKTEALSKCSVDLPVLPKSISWYGFAGKLYSTVDITNITYEFNCDNKGRVELEMWFSGKKTYDYKGNNQSSQCLVGWKLYGPDGSVFKTGTFMSPSLSAGETFTNKSQNVLYLHESALAGKYKLEIIDVMS